MAATVLLGGWSIAAAQDEEPRDTPRLALDAGGHTAMINCLHFRPGNKELVTVSDDKTIRIWDVASGEPLEIMRPPVGDGDHGMIYTSDISPDGELLAVSGYTGSAGSQSHPIYLISLTTGTIVRVLEGHSNVVQDVAFSKDGKLLISGSNDNLGRIWNVSNGECLQVLTGHTESIYCVAFSPDAKLCATAADDDTAAIWSVTTGQRQTVLKGHQEDVNALDWSPNGRMIATGSFDHTIRLWRSDGGLVRVFDDLGGHNISSLTFTNDSRRILWSNGFGGKGDFTTGLLDLQSGEVTVKFTNHNNTVKSATLSPDGSLAASTGGDHKATFVWKTSDGSQVQKFVGRGKVNWAAAWSEDGNRIAWGNDSRGSGVTANAPLEASFDLTRLQFGDAPDDSFVRARLERGSTKLARASKTTVDVLRGGERSTTLQFTSQYYQSYNRIRCFSLLPSERAAVGAEFGLYLFDTRTGKRIRQFVGHTGAVWAVSSSPDGRYLLSAANDMTMRIWDPDQDQPLLNLFFAGEEWVAWTPKGYYASSPGGEALMGWHLDNGPEKLGSFARASQFRDSLYQPAAIKMLLRTGNIARALEVTGSGDRDTSVAQVIPPTVFIARPDGNEVKTDSEEMTVMVGARQVGMHPITSIQLLLDGRPYGGRAGVKHFDTPQRDVRERFYVQLSPGIRHRLQVRADSAVSYGLSRAVNVTYQPKSNTRRLPALYVLAVGVKDYQDDDLDLNYADQDARRLEQAFNSYGKGLFREVQTKLMVNSQATQRGILTGLDWLKRQMSQGDIGVVYYSGHGDKDSSGVFHLMPHDVERDLLSVTGVSDAQIKTMVGAINGRVLMLLDACNSGAAAFKNPSSLSDDLVRDLVSDDFGITVMSSSTGKELSQESSDDRGGYFTIAFVEGLSGKADANQDGVIYSSELANYVADRVKTLTKGQQHPVMRNPAGVPAFPLSKTK